MMTGVGCVLPTVDSVGTANCTSCGLWGSERKEERRNDVVLVFFFFISHHTHTEGTRAKTLEPLLGTELVAKRSKGWMILAIKHA